ncbi:rRNA maturation RNase YbeY [Polycladidibacter stylochi]|uniref:rRNA maturation RNase YbeY n=1 Tax=Polycladidibacter stylochi TaxID=1807766 RepID=UPI00082CF496|nr:rRNA maturation RNase YbeY [Pseudovibrio stylochi]
MSEPVCPVHIDVTIEEDSWPQEEELLVLAQKAFAQAFLVADLPIAPASEVSLVFTNDENIRVLNRQWREKDKPTNVLSFPGDEGDTLPFGPLLGDIVIAWETVQRESREMAIPFLHHLTHLMIHGLLHLFDYDHMTSEEAEEMEQEERIILAALEIPDPYKDMPLHIDE